MSLTVVSIAGLPGVPATNRGGREWLKRLDIALQAQGSRLIFNLSDLPEPVRIAYTERQIAAAGLVKGTYDDAAHAGLAAACPSIQAKALRKAVIARFLVTAGKALTWPQKVAMVAQKFGPEGASKPHLKRLLRAVEGVDPINFAPALLPGHKGSQRAADMSPEAWGFFHDHGARCWRGVPADTGVARCARRVYQAGLAMAVAGDSLAALGSPTTGATAPCPARARRNYHGFGAAGDARQGHDQRLGMGVAGRSDKGFLGAQRRRKSETLHFTCFG